MPWDENNDGYNGHDYGGGNTSNSSDNGSDYESNLADSYNAGYNRAEHYTSLDPDRYHDTFAGIRDTYRQLGYSDVDISDVIGSMGSPYSQRAGLVGFVDAIANGSPWSKTLAKAANWGLGLTPFGQLANLGDWTQKLATTGWNKYSGLQGLGLLSGGITDPFARTALNTAGSFLAGDTKRGLGTLGSFMGSQIGGEMGGRWGSLAGSALGGQLANLGGSYNGAMNTNRTKTNDGNEHQTYYMSF